MEQTSKLKLSLLSPTDNLDWEEVNRNFEYLDNAVIDYHSKIYGVSIDLSNSNPETSVTYTDDAVGMAAGSADWYNTPIYSGIRPCLLKAGDVVGYLNPNNFAEFEDGTSADITSGDAGDVMIEIPKLGYRIAKSGNTLTVQVTDHPNKAGFSYLAHTRQVEGDREKLYIGTYLGSIASSKLRSLSGVYPTVNVAIGGTRTAARANGSGYDQIAFYQLTLLQCLFLIKYKNRDSQTALGRGYVDDLEGAGGINTGGTETRGMDYGENTGLQHMKFLGIEDFWGNLYYWIDGLVSDRNYHALTATNNFNDPGSGYTDQGQMAASYVSGYMKAPQGTNETGFIAKQGGGSATTYFTDRVYLEANSVPYFGGTWDDESTAGAFHLFVSNGTSYADPYICGRLMYL